MFVYICTSLRSGLGFPRARSDLLGAKRKWPAGMTGRSMIMFMLAEESSDLQRPVVYLHNGIQELGSQMERYVVAKT